MKSYLSAFLLFFLLVGQSLSPAAGISLGPITKGATTVYKGLKGSKYFWEKFTEKVTEEVWKRHNSHPSPANPPPPQIKGLSLIKDYLYNYGYLQSSGTPFNDSLDEETISSIKTYQQYFNLQVTGDLNNQTLQQISLPRCYLPDMNFDYGFVDQLSFPKAGHRWFPKGRNLTYGFLPVSKIPKNMTKVFRDAFMRWANASEVLNLTETTYDNADIKVGLYNLTDLGDKVYGYSLIIKQPSSDVKVGEIFLNGNKFWALPSENHRLSWQDGVLDLESVALHQIGHLLGLDHSNNNESIMYPYILPSQQRKVQLSDSDKGNIQHENINANFAEGGRWGRVLLIGFAYILLFYWLSSYTLA